MPQAIHYTRHFLNALRICSKHYHEPYQNLLEYYPLPSLQNRRLFLCLCTFHSIVNGLVYLPNETFLPPAVTVTSRRNGNPHAYRVPHAHLNGLYFSFVCITIRASVDALCRDGASQISRERVQCGRLTLQGPTS